MSVFSRAVNLYKFSVPLRRRKIYTVRNEQCHSLLWRRVKKRRQIPSTQLSKKYNHNKFRISFIGELHWKIARKIRPCVLEGEVFWHWLRTMRMNLHMELVIRLFVLVLLPFHSIRFSVCAAKFMYAMAIVLYGFSLARWSADSYLLPEVNDDDEITVARDKYAKYTEWALEKFFSSSVCMCVSNFFSFVVETIGFSLRPIKM